MKEFVRQAVGYIGTRIKKAFVWLWRLPERYFVEPRIRDAFALLQEAFEGWDFVSWDIKYAMAHINDLDPKGGCSPIFDLLNANTSYKKGWAKVKIEVGEALLALGARLDGKFQDEPILHFYISRREQEIAEWLIQRGADVNARDQWGQTPLMKVALCEGEYSTAEVLIAHHADVEAKDQCGRDVMHYTRCSGRHLLAHQIESAATSAATQPAQASPSPSPSALLEEEEEVLTQEEAQASVSAVMQPQQTLPSTSPLVGVMVVVLTQVEEVIQEEEAQTPPRAQPLHPHRHHHCQSRASTLRIQ